jgi:site-specific DNA-methyltransferase (adenine-specific)
VKPYYQDDLVTIYHGDALEVVPRLLRESMAADVVVTDPPYGIAWRRGVNNARQSKAHEGIQGDRDVSVRDGVLSLMPGRPAIIFGSFYAPFPCEVRQVLVWHKPADAGLVGSVTGFRRDAEPIFLTGPWPVRFAEQSSILHILAGQSGTVTATGHPHTKPLALMVRLLEAAPPGTVLDPFAGSGSTLVAAKSLGRRAIGIEIEERYCEIAAQRCSQEVLGLSS